MGAWIYQVAAAAAKKRKDDAAIAASRRRARNAREAREEKRRESDRKYRESQAEERYKRIHSIDGLYECVLKEISYRHKNSELLEFIEKFYEYGLKIDKQDSKDLSIKGEALTEELRKKAVELEKNREKVEQLGITIEENDYNRHIPLNKFFSVKNKAGEELGYSYGEPYFIKDEERIYKHYLFNGLNLTEESLKDPNYDGFYAEYEKTKEWHESSINEEDELLKKLKRNKTFLKFSIFHRDDRKKENEDIETSLKYIQFCKDEVEAARIKYETFKNLTPEQKEAILEYIQTRKQCEDLEHEIKEKICDEMDSIYTFMHTRPRYDTERREKSRDKWNRALKLMIEEGIITREDLTNVVKMLAKVEEKQQNNEYDEDFKIWDSDGDGKLEKYQSGIKWFIENIYISKDEREKSEEIVR